MNYPYHDCHLVKQKCLCWPVPSFMYIHMYPLSYGNLKKKHFPAPRIINNSLIMLSHFLIIISRFYENLPSAVRCTIEAFIAPSFSAHFPCLFPSVFLSFFPSFSAHFPCLSSSIYLSFFSSPSFHQQVPERE